MKITNTHKKFIAKHINGLRETMRLTHFVVQTKFATLSDSTMEIETDYRYLEAQLLIDREKFLYLWKRDKGEIIAFLAHELSHIITQEMSDPFASKNSKTVVMSLTKQHFEERVTETVSRLALRLYKLEILYGKD